MDDFISRQAAIDAIEPTLKSILQGNSFKAINVMDKIRELPSAQPERKTGKWIFVRGEEAGNALYMCSECSKGDIHAPEVRVSYCWNCGANMRGDQDEAD